MIKAVASVKWFLLEEIPCSHWLLTVPPISRWADLRKYGVEEIAGYSLIESEEGTEKLYFVRERMDASGKWILTKLLADPSWGEKLNADLIRAGQAFFDFSESIRRKDYSAASNAELAADWEKHMLLHGESHSMGMVWNTLEFDRPLFSNYLTGYLAGLANGDKARAAESFSILTTHLRESFAQKEEKSMLAFAAGVQAEDRAMNLFLSLPPLQAANSLSTASPSLASQFEAHVREFCWLPYMYQGPAWGSDYFAEVLGGLVKQKEEGCKALLEKNLQAQSELALRQEKLAGSLGVDAKHARLFAIARDMVFTKGFRKDCAYHGFYCIEPLLKEAAKRLGVSLNQLRRFSPGELHDAIRTNSADANMLEERFKYSVYYADAVAGKIEKMHGGKARAFMARLDFEQVRSSESGELKGDCACPGSAAGIVKVIERADQMGKMNQGDVLVAHSTNPDIVPAMKKAAAIVTDVGGITSHAAIISRELGVPCVVGTKMATKVLKDGDFVSVDATLGTIAKRKNALTQ